MSVPAGALYLGGFAVSPDGALYVTPTGDAAITGGTIDGVALGSTTPYRTYLGYSPTSTQTDRTALAVDNLHNYSFAYSDNSSFDTAHDNVRIGWLTGNALTTGYSNSFGGNGAGRKTTTGFYNSIWGSDAFHENTTGRYGAAIGTNAGYENTTAHYTTALGDGALRYNTIMDGQTAVGRDALSGSNPASNTGAANVGVGRASGYYLTTGTGNTIAGTFSGYYVGDAADENRKIKTDTYLSVYGYSARKNSASALTNSSAFGANAEVTRSNQIALGDSGIKEVKAGDKNLPIVEVQSFVAVTAPLDTTINTLATVTIPANKMGPNGSVRITAFYSWPSSANSKTAWVKYNGSGGSFVGGQVSSTSTTMRVMVVIANRNSASSQVGWFSGITNLGTTTVQAAVTTSANTAADTTALLMMQLDAGAAGASEVVKLEGYICEIIYGA